MSEYIRVGCAVPPVMVGDVNTNVEDICSYMSRAYAQNCNLLVFPEMALTGYTCQDLFFQQTLIRSAANGLGKLVKATEQYPNMIVVVGLPVIVEGQLYNCAAVLGGGKLWGIVPKTYLPNHNEFDEKRWFGEANDLQCTEIDSTTFGLDQSYAVSIGNDLLFSIGGTKVGVEICEDLWAPIPPSSVMKVNGAEVIVNLAASNAGVGKRCCREDLVKHQSAFCAYAFCSAGCTESTQDLVFSGHSVIAAGGEILVQSQDEPCTDYLLMQDVDLDMLRADRCSNASFRQAAGMFAEPFAVVDCCVTVLRSDGSMLPISKRPFVPEEPIKRAQRCIEVFNTQVAALMRRLQITDSNAVIGISGGLDSTLALLVTVEAMHRLSRPLTDVYALTMPCFGTSDRTYQNALQLMQVLGISNREVDIRKAVLQHFRNIDHDPEKRDTTYENAQARERTQVLMDYAGEKKAIVIGTGDLSELALGWCTYNGDHMSMYSVNCSVPKTLIPWIIRTVVERPLFASAQAILEDILDTPISPELLPPDEQGVISQQTEDMVGPYVLHDFFLYYLVRYGFAPSKIYTLACRAFSGEYESATIKKWLGVFYCRFFSQQFKRDCVPDGVKVGSVGLSPRGDWRMPSDACTALWLHEIENLAE